ncbi:MAG TPA: 16S rRNA (adenine(1518)-N(6)/adenine(1519)-N(6))-dimethyltransferase RsmA [Euzebyales bacterium]|nr:16S rRNA (adenine(1518)-N(6)/adenine(1519)-N(6))-dimethyltransferase RsmA [Euzebyales bacterium]
MLTAADVRDLLRRHGLAPNRRLGQNFVVDHNTLRKMVHDAGVRPGDHVCEIGPGLGSLTLALREAGAQVTAIEVDAGLVRALADVVGDDPQVRIVPADVRTGDRPARVPRPALVVANLPYSVATAVTLDLLATEHFERLHLLVQREVGLRWCAKVDDELFGAVSLKVEAHADARVVAAVSRRAFHPVPRVDSVTVGLSPRPWPETRIARPAVLALVEMGFTQRRKRLRNALGPRVPPAAVDDALAVVGRSPDTRAEQLDLRTWCEFAVALRERHIAGWESTALA